MPFYTNAQGVPLDDVDGAQWFHGSPERLTTLTAGSAITRNRRLAEAFSHKPTLLSVSNRGRIRHNGKRPGFLYVVDELVGAEDAESHPAVVRTDPWEWTTKRDLKLRLVGRTTISAGETGWCTSVACSDRTPDVVPWTGGGRERSMRDTEWFARRRWGVFCHYLTSPQTTVDEWNRRVDAFDVAALAGRLASVNAGYFFITVGQGSGHYCAPNPTYDAIAGVRPSKCSDRDLVADLYEALCPRDIDLLVYVPADGSNGDPEARKGMKLTAHWHEAKVGCPNPGGRTDPRSFRQTARGHWRCHGTRTSRTVNPDEPTRMTAAPTRTTRSCAAFIRGRTRRTRRVSRRPARWG